MRCEEENNGNVVELFESRRVSVAFKRGAFSSFRGKRQADFGDFSGDV
jgi:hypothetical protein